MTANADLDEVYETERHLLLCGLHPCPRPSVRDRRQSGVGVPGRFDRLIAPGGSDPRNCAAISHPVKIG
jgi:hypothetical protein